MSAEIVKVYTQDVPAVRFIGKKYGDSDRVDGMFGKHWGDWFQNGWFEVIEKQTNKDITALYDDADAYIGLMRDNNGEFEYWIGILMPEETPVPDGYEYHDFPKAKFGVCWVHGKEEEVYSQEERCADKLEQMGYTLSEWCMERYCCPRFTTPDENGKVVLDICFYLK